MTTQSLLEFAVTPEPQPKPYGFVLRDYQRIDADAIDAAWADERGPVLCVHATGIGKSVLIAEMCRRKPAEGRALVVVDSTALAYDLWRTIKKHCECQPGILSGDEKQGLDADILVATKQCLCVGEKYLSLDMMQYERMLVDECESSLANEYVVLMSHCQTANPRLKIAGCTATPLPASNRAISDFYTHAATSPGPLYRDLQWSYLNGWLVKPMQGMLRCSMDFSSLKVRKRADGERDYSDKDIAKLMLASGEREWMELAGGIYQIAKGRTAIVVCPNSTEVADKLAGYIEGQAIANGESDIARSIHRTLGRRESWSRMRAFKNGKFPIAVSVRMFEKGFDYDKVDMVVMARRTKSLRLYTQIAGRATRPLIEIRGALNECPDANGRMAIIAQSAKPSCVIVDCVGIKDRAKDLLGVIDILGRGVRDDVRERVRRIMLDRLRLRDSVQGRPSDDEADEPADVGDVARQAVGELRSEWEARRRSRISATVDISYKTGDAKIRHGKKRGERGARMPFGKYRGELIRDLSTGYLKTLREKCPISTRWLADAIDRTLASRG